MSAEQKQEAVVKPLEVEIPVGWYLVPEVPTEEQMAAGLYQSSHDAEYADVCQSYMDMVRAGPDAPELFAAPPAASSQERIAQLEAQVAEAAKVTEQCAKIADRVANNNRRGTSPEAFAAFTVATEIARYIREIKPSAALVGAAK